MRRIISKEINKTAFLTTHSFFSFTHFGIATGAAVLDVSVYAALHSIGNDLLTLSTL
jgi:hypothetical protein